jgi:hypothetical protein
MIPALPVKVELYYFDSLKIVSNDQFEIGEDVPFAEMTDLELDQVYNPEDASLDVILKLSVAKSKADFKRAPYRITGEFHALFSLPDMHGSTKQIEEDLPKIFFQCVYDAYGMMRMALAQITASCRNTEIMLPTFDAGEYFTLLKKPENFN